MRAWLAIWLALIPLGGWAAETYPARPIRIVITVVPGGGADITARAVGQKLTEAWGQQVIVDNRPGGNGAVGMAIAANANPDGYTIVEGTIGPVAVNPSLYSKLPYDPVKDFVAVARAVSALNVLVVHPSLPVKSVQELIAYAKTNPGKLTYGSSGVGFADHLAGELFCTLAGVRMVHVPYKGGAPAMLDLVGGNIQLIFATVSTAIVHVKAGKLRALAVTSAKRVDLLPDLPTVAEAGVPGYAAATWTGVIAPAGVPRAIVDKLNAAINKAMTSEAFKEKFAKTGDEPGGGTPEEFAQTIKADSAKWGDLIKRAGIKM